MWKISTSKEAVNVEFGFGHALFHCIHPKQKPDLWAVGHTTYFIFGGSHPQIFNFLVGMYAEIKDQNVVLIHKKLPSLSKRTSKVLAH